MDKNYVLDHYTQNYIYSGMRISRENLVINFLDLTYLYS